MIDQEKKIIQKIVVGGVVFKNGKALILQRHKDEDTYPNMWELPSGKREFLESSENALVREIHEETGLTVKPLMPFSVFEYQVEKPNEIRDSTQINFLVALVKDQDLVLSTEHQAFAWIELQEIDQYDLTKTTKEVIRRAFKITPETIHQL